MLAKLVQVLSAAALVLYPVAVFLGVRTGNLGLWLGLATLFIAPTLLLRMRGRVQKGRVQTLALLPLLTLTLLGLSALFKSQGLAMMTPVAISAVFLFVFARSLWWGPPMIEQFARLIDPVLNEAQIRWCRLWTIIWSGFFLLNGLCAALLAAFAPLLWWSLYTSLIAYLIMGLLFAAEYLGRPSTPPSA